MALTDTTTAAPISWGKIISSPFRAIGNFLVLIMENNSRVQLVERLNAMSDEQLAAKGIKRDDIVRYVFRDYL